MSLSIPGAGLRPSHATGQAGAVATDTVEGLIRRLPKQLRPQGLKVHTAPHISAVDSGYNPGEVALFVGLVGLHADSAVVRHELGHAAFDEFLLAAPTGPATQLLQDLLMQYRADVRLPGVDKHAIDAHHASQPMFHMLRPYTELFADMTAVLDLNAPDVVASQIGDATRRYSSPLSDSDVAAGARNYAPLQPTGAHIASLFCGAQHKDVSKRLRVLSVLAEAILQELNSRVRVDGGQVQTLQLGPKHMHERLTKTFDRLLLSTDLG